MQVLERDPRQIWLEGIDAEKTRETYGRALKRLCDVSKLSPLEMLQEARGDMKCFWVHIKADAGRLTPHMKGSALSALRSYLRAHGEFPPYDRLQRPRRARRSARITWDQALKIADAASPPYRWIFRLQLHCGWGIGEFFEWNQTRNWEMAKKAIGAYPPPEYFRFEFDGRKSNDQPFHTLIPTFALSEVLEATSDFPLRTRGGQPINHENYHSAKVSVDSAFKTALQRSHINPNGHLSPHDFRDVFRTEGTIKGVDFDAREFAIGHTIDPRGYDKCYNDLTWLWKELSKIYKHETFHNDPQAATLREELEQLKLAVRTLQDASGLKVVTSK